MYEKKTIKNETNQKTFTGNKTTAKHTLTNNKVSSSCNSCGVCRRLRSPHLSSTDISSALFYAKTMGKESCAAAFMQKNYGNAYLQRTAEQERVVSSPLRSTTYNQPLPIINHTPYTISHKPYAINQHSEQLQISEIMSNKGSGQKLDDNTRSFMEQRFGYDFSHVRLHTDNYAVRKANELNAEAFTIGRDVFFNAGRYNLSSMEGKRLLAHELTHVVQQGSKTSIQKLGENPKCSTTETKTIHQAIYDARGWINKAIPKLEETPPSESVIKSLRRNFGPTYGVTANIPLIVNRIRAARSELSTMPIRCDGSSDHPLCAARHCGHAIPGSHEAAICRNVTLVPGTSWVFQAACVLHESFHAKFSNFTVDEYSGWYGKAIPSPGYPGTGTEPLLNADSYTTLVMDLS